MATNIPKYLIIHHVGGTDADPLLDTSSRTFAQINEAHRLDSNINLGYPSSLGYYIGYHYYIAKDGAVTQGRKDTDEGAHARGYNLQSLGICLAGNFDLTTPTASQIAALSALLFGKTAQYIIPVSNILPHRAFAVKTCYGRNLADSWAAELLKPRTTPAPCTTERETLAEQAAQIGRWNAFWVALKAVVNNFKP